MREVTLLAVRHLDLQKLKKSKGKTLWRWLVFIYRTASVGYIAYEIYANQWILRAITAALFTAPDLLAMLL